MWGAGVRGEVFGYLSLDRFVGEVRRGGVESFGVGGGRGFGSGFRVAFR